MSAVNEFQSEVEKYKDLIRKEKSGDNSDTLLTEIAQQL